MGRLIINGEEVYELDEACLRKKCNQSEVKKDIKKQRVNKTEKEQKK